MTLLSPRLVPLVACAALYGLGQPVAATESPTGFTFGATTGYEAYDIDIRTPSQRLGSLQADGGFAGLFASATSTLPDLGGLIGGLEARYVFSDAEGSAASAGERVSVRARETWGVDARLGRAFNNALVYTRAGWSRTEFSGLDTSGRDDLDGMRIGAGVELAMNREYTVRGEVTRTFYEDFNSNGRRVDAGANALTVGLTRRL